ncbi:hypothetical protein D5S18_00725 [Nocardia panacis]|uniref:Uncharacterized protein n=1 Tax=Nocardia panacis TaxID=2340916 RepID=A0A3A4L978_9NOCA|nr:hypothetical protein D5S18_00725 [Nocardia panacis]
MARAAPAAPIAAPTVGPRMVEPIPVARAGNSLEERLESFVGQRHSRRPLRIALLFTVMLGVLAVLGVRSCVAHLPSLSSLPAVPTMPDMVRSALNCRPFSSPDADEKCVIMANNPLLNGGIAGGADLTVYLQQGAPDRLQGVIAKWQAQGAQPISGGRTFVAIGPSANVMFADTRSGLRLETGTFASRGAAQAFISRSGLLF